MINSNTTGIDVLLQSLLLFWKVTKVALVLALGNKALMWLRCNVLLRLPAAHCTLLELLRLPCQILKKYIHLNGLERVLRKRSSSSVARILAVY